MAVLECKGCKPLPGYGTAGAEFQDRRYGKGKRVMNKTTKSEGDRTVYRCTVCNGERSK